MSSHRPTSTRHHHETVYAPRHLVLGWPPAASPAAPGAVTGDGEPSRHDGWLVDLIERLFQDFENRYQLTDILRIVRQCRQQLDAVADAALPDVLERLARQRLAAGLVPRAS